MKNPPSAQGVERTAIAITGLIVCLVVVWVVYWCVSMKVEGAKDIILAALAIVSLFVGGIFGWLGRAVYEGVHAKTPAPREEAKVETPEQK